MGCASVRCRFYDNFVMNRHISLSQNVLVNVLTGVWSEAMYSGPVWRRRGSADLRAPRRDGRKLRWLANDDHWFTLGAPSDKLTDRFTYIDISFVGSPTVHVWHRSK